MNANEIVENEVSGIKWQARIGVETRVFILEKVISCLDLRYDQPIFNKGCWGLDTCGCLIGGPYGHIVWVSFFWDVVTSLTTAALLWWLQHTSLSTTSCPRQLWPYKMWSASCNRTTNVACMIILFSKLLSYSYRFTTWSAGQQPGRRSVKKPEAC